MFEVTQGSLARALFNFVVLANKLKLKAVALPDYLQIKIATTLNI